MFSLIVIENNKITSVPLDDETKEYIICRKDYWSTEKKQRRDRSVVGIVLDSPHISIVNGRLTYDGLNWSYEDLGDKSKSSLNGKCLSKHRAYSIKDGDRIIIRGEESVECERGIFISFIKGYHNLQWDSFGYHDSEVINIGRDDSNDIVLTSRYVSGRHAMICIDGDNTIIKDLNSKNGIYLNGEKKTGEVVVDNYDVIKIGDKYIFLIENEIISESDRPQDDPNTNQEKVVLEAHIKSKRVKKRFRSKELIKNIDVKITEGSLVALLGVSGAGKTTLMDCLNGMDTSGMDGSVLYRGHDLVKNFDKYKNQIGSVPQENVFHAELDVESELKKSAELKLSKNVPEDKKMEHVDWVIRKLKLENVRYNQISLCSGGEKKRVNIAIDLVADRDLLCLDEPDAGLDPEMKRELFEILRDLAHDDKKSIIVIIHDVSELQLFDQVIILAKKNNVGRLAFSGSPEDAEKYFGTPIKNVYRLLADNPKKYIKD